MKRTWGAAKGVNVYAEVSSRNSESVHSHSIPNLSNLYNQLGKLVQSGRLASQIQAVLKSILNP
jgi:hypothetical protein